jgi:hypothetical protein
MWVVSFTAWPLYPRERAPGTHAYKISVGKTEGKRPVRRLGVYERIILK